MTPIRMPCGGGSFLKKAVGPKPGREPLPVAPGHDCLHNNSFVVRSLGLGRASFQDRIQSDLRSPQFATSLGYQKAGSYGPGSFSEYPCDQRPVSRQTQSGQKAQTLRCIPCDHYMRLSLLPFHKRVIWSRRARAIWFRHGFPVSPRAPCPAVWPASRS